MNFFQSSALFLVTFLIQLNYYPVVCDLLDDIELTPTGDEFWGWIFGSDDNETE